VSNEKIINALTKSVRALIWLVAFLFALIIFLVICLETNIISKSPDKNPDSVRVSKFPNTPVVATDTMWHAPDISSIPQNEQGDQIRYGRDLIVRTSYYFGPKGTIEAMTNGMNCQNCHLDAGTKPLGNNYSAVASTYPKMRARSGQIESIEKRVSDCFERSLNGKSPANDSREMKAIVAYINWLGKDVVKKDVPAGSGIANLKFLDRAADPAKGKLVYDLKCKSCHNENGEGQMGADGLYTYPPLWGDHSYNVGAGLFRLSRFAGYVEMNMPFGASYAKTQLTPEEAWDVAAFVNSQKRPGKDLSKDWPDISKKPVDHPFGPYSDKFSEEQHKFGPFAPIKAAQDVKK
jgi:thiosulfate dehydrogenase